MTQPSSLTAPVVMWSADHVPNALKLRANLYVRADARQQSAGGSSLMAVEGCGTLGAHFVTDTESAQYALETLGIDLRDAASHMRGSLCLFGFDQDRGEAVIAPDPFGAALVFFYRSAKFSAASSNIRALVSAIESVGLRVRRSLKYAVEVALIGNAGLTPSPYEGIDLLPNFSRLIFNSDGMKIEELPWVHTLFRNYVIDDGERRQGITNEILGNTLAATQGDFSRKVAHLTGGFDSRLVLATILHHNARAHFTLHTTGDPKLPDMVCAATVAAGEGLRMSHYPGYAQKSVPERYESRIRASLDYSGGLIHIGPHEGCEHDRALILAGGYGEIMRSFFDSRFEARNLSLIDQFERISWVSRKVAPNRAMPLISRDFATQLRQGFERHLGRAEDLGIRDDARLDYFYLANRNRYWVGLLSFLWSRVAFRFDPLYSVSAAASSLMTPREIRAENFIGLDQMMTIRPQLLQYPYDRDMAGPEYRRLRLWPAPMKAASAKSPRWIDEPIQHSDRWPDDSGSTFTVPKATASDIGAARKARVTPVQWASRDVVTKRVRELIGDIEATEVDSIFNRSELDILLASQPNTMGYIRLINLLHAYLLWYVEPK